MGSGGLGHPTVFVEEPMDKYKTEKKKTFCCGAQNIKKIKKRREEEAHHLRHRGRERQAERQRSRWGREAHKHTGTQAHKHTGTGAQGHGWPRGTEAQRNRGSARLGIRARGSWTRGTKGEARKSMDKKGSGRTRRGSEGLDRTADTRWEDIVPWCMWRVKGQILGHKSGSSC